MCRNAWLQIIDQESRIALEVRPRVHTHRGHMSQLFCILLVSDDQPGLTLGLREEEDAEHKASALARAEQDVHTPLQGAQHGEEALADDGAVDHRHEDSDALAQATGLQGLDLRGNDPAYTAVAISFPVCMLPPRGRCSRQPHSAQHLEYISAPF